MTLDLLTVVFLTALSAFLMGASILLAGRTQSSSDPSLKSVGVGCLGQSLGWVLLGTRERLPDEFSVFGANLMLVGSSLCYLHAINIWVDATPGTTPGATPARSRLRQALDRAFWPLASIFTCALFYLSLVRPDLSARVVLTSLAQGAISGGCAVRLLKAQPLPKSRRIVGCGFALVVAMQALRIAMIWLNPPPSTDVLSAMVSQTGTLIFGHIAVVMLTFLFVLMVHDRTARELRELVTLDYLTGIFNRSAFEGYARQAIEQARRSGDPLALMLFDVDHFKGINDTLGHLTGDVALRTLADLTTETLRSQDVFGRYGGEEFAVLLPVTDAPGALLVAERLREAVAATQFRDEDTPFRLTISLGIAQFSPRGETSTEQRLTALFRAADAALYDAKRAGRNRTLIADSQPELDFSGEAEQSSDAPTRDSGS